MARIVDLLETDYAAQLRRRKHPLLGAATVNVGTISGGTQPNIVPDRCTISIDRRTLPGETEAGVRREIAALLRAKNLSANISSAKLAPALPLETDPKLPLVRQFLRSVGQSKPAGVDFFCDAAVLSAGGIPSVVFGPGDIAQAHTADEWISLAELERGKNLLLTFPEIAAVTRRQGSVLWDVFPGRCPGLLSVSLSAFIRFRRDKPGFQFVFTREIRVVSLRSLQRFVTGPHISGNTFPRVLFASGCNIFRHTIRRQFSCVGEPQAGAIVLVAARPRQGFAIKIRISFPLEDSPPRPKQPAPAPQPAAKR